MTAEVGYHYTNEPSDEYRKRLVSEYLMVHFYKFQSTAVVGFEILKIAKYWIC